MAYRPGVDSLDTHIECLLLPARSSHRFSLAFLISKAFADWAEVICISNKI